MKGYMIVYMSIVDVLCLLDSDYEQTKAVAFSAPNVTCAHKQAFLIPYKHCIDSFETVCKLIEEQSEGVGLEEFKIKERRFMEEFYAYEIVPEDLK